MLLMLRWRFSHWLKVTKTVVILEKFDIEQDVQVNNNSLHVSNTQASLSMSTTLVRHRAVDLLCICAQTTQTTTFEWNDHWPKYLACCFKLILYRWHSKVKVIGNMAQLIPADPTATHCLLLQEIQIGFGFTFLVPAHPGSPGQNPEP